MTLTPGAKLGPYEVIGAIGAGGMGEVYRALDTRLGRDVAVKILPAGFAADEDRLRRFEREARAAGALSHPNIVAVFDVGTHEGAPFLVTELLEGETLRARMTGGALPPAKAIDVARQVADGLAAAHEKGITHRDIKPENLFVSPGGRVKILDFGLAKQTISADTDVTQAHTEAGVVMGTLGYMSPEQVRGQKVDSRTDIFALGAVLYEMLSGARAFVGASAVESMHAILEADPAPLAAPILRIFPSIGWIVARCLEKNPAERFHSAHDLSLALGSVTAASGPAPQQTPSASARRRRASSRVAAWLAVIVAAATMGAFVHQRLATPVSADPITMDSLTYSGHDASPAASPDGKTVAFMSDRDGVPRIWLKQVSGGGELALTQGPDNLPRFSRDGSSIIFIRTLPSGPALFRVPLLGGDPVKLIDDVTGADWSPAGRQLAFTRWVSGDRSGSVIGVAEADGHGEREVAFVTGRSLTSPRWSPDGRMIASVNALAIVANGFGVEIADVALGRSRRLERPGSSMRQSSVIWSADSRSVIYSEAESVLAWMTGSSARVIRQDIATGAWRVLAWTVTHSQTIDAFADGRLLLDMRSSRENLREIALGSGSVAPRWLTQGNSTDRQPVYSPDGQWVVFASNRGGNLDLWAVNRATGNVRRLTDDPGDDWDVAYALSGQRLLFGSNRSGPYEIWTAALDGSSPRQLSHDGVFAQNPSETPDGQWVVYASTNPKAPGLWRMRADGRDAVRISSVTLQLPDMSPDGRHVLFVDGITSEICVVRLEDGTPVPPCISVTRHKDTTAQLGRARWMPGGRAIAFVGQDDRGVNGLFVQDFVPGRDTTSTRRPLAGFDPEFLTESFGISPDGTRAVIAAWEQMFNVMITSPVSDAVRR